MKTNQVPSELDSNAIRKEATSHFVVPARRSGAKKLTIAVRDSMSRFPAEVVKGKQSVFCSALRAKSFLRENGLRLEAMDGPPQGRGTSVVYHYRFEADDLAGQGPARGPMSEEDAERLAEAYLAPLRGLLAKEIAAFGGTEAYMRWVRSDEPTA